MKTIALIDPFWDGHHTTYLREFSGALLSLGLEVMVFCSRPDMIRDWINDHSVTSNHNGNIHFYRINEPGDPVIHIRILSRMVYALKQWHSAGQAIKMAFSETGRLPDLVFFPWLDDYLSCCQNRHIIDRIFPYDWAGLYFHPPHFRPQIKIRRWPLDLTELLHSDRCKAVGLLDEGIAPLLQERLKHKPVIVFPDVTDESTPDFNSPVIRNIKSLAGKRKIVSLLGSLEKRKGVLTLLEIAQQTASQDLFFLFAGKIAENSFTSAELALLRRLAANCPQNCYLHFDYLENESHFNALVETSNIIFAAYDNFLHSSNVLTKAAVFNKRVIVSRGHCMEERVNRYNLGVSIDYGNVGQGIEAIRSLLNNSDVNDNPRQPDFDGFRRLHSRERLAAAFQEVLQCCRI